jgi:hypothetical protein
VVASEALRYFPPAQTHGGYGFACEFDVERTRPSNRDSDPHSDTKEPFLLSEGYPLL